MAFTLHAIVAAVDHYVVETMTLHIGPVRLTTLSIANITMISRSTVAARHAVVIVTEFAVASGPHPPHVLFFFVDLANWFVAIHAGSFSLFQCVGHGPIIFNEPRSYTLIKSGEEIRRTIKLPPKCHHGQADR